MSLRVAVVGAGLAGVSTAFELALRGAAVTLYERNGSVAEQASFAGAATLMPPLDGLSAPLPGPLSWRWKRRRAAGQAAPLSSLAIRSQARLDELRHQLRIDDEAGRRLLVLLSHKARVAALEAQLPAWREQGLSAELLDLPRAHRREPGLNPEARLEAALAIGPAGSGNARLLTQALRLHAQKLGVEFRFHTTVQAVEPGAPLTLRHAYTPPELAVRASRDASDTLPAPPEPQQERFDAVVLCCGLASFALLKPLGRKLPLFALHEASVTAPLRVLEAHPELGPQAAVLDPERGISMVRIGQRVRVSGERCVTGVTDAPPRIDFERLHQGLQAWFPGSVQLQQVQHWQTRRAVLPDGLPLLGASGLPGLWLNLSPNLDGWGLALGGAEVLAQQITGASPTLDLTALDARRLA